MKVAIGREFCKQIFRNWGVTIDVLPQLMGYVYRNTNNFDILFERHPEVQWDIRLLSYKDISLELVEKIIDDCYCSGHGISMNKNITWDFIVKHF